MNTIPEAANMFADKHAFRVPYNGSKDFYDKVDFKASEDGFNAGAQFALSWILVEDELPEHSPSLIATRFEGFETSKNVIVKTNHDRVMGSFRHKNEGEWTWYYSQHHCLCKDETIVAWRILDL